jgi:DNA excision repair protein ERCC-4
MIPPRVVVDERERQSGVPEKLAQLDVRVYYSTLPVADYVVSPEIAIERKSLRDFVSSVYDGRLFVQASEISTSYRKPYIIVEGDVKEVVNLTRNINSYFGAIASVTLAYDLRLLFTATPDETAMAIAALVRNSRARPAPPGSSFNPPPKGRDLPQQQLYFVSAIPGIGPKLAKRLLARAGTPRRAIAFTEAQLAMVPGMGWKKAEKITRMLDTAYAAQGIKPVQEKLGEQQG